MHNPFTTKDPLLDIINQVVLGEKKLTDAELKKREEIAKAMERDNPGMDMGKKMAIATAQAKKVAEEVELDEAATRKEVKKVYSKKGNHIGTIYHVDNGKDKPFISAHYHPGGFMNNSLSLKSHEDAEKWIHHSHSSHLEHAKARHDEAKMELRQHEKHLKSIPEEVEQIDEGKENHNEKLIKYADKKLKGWNKTVTHNTKKTKTNDPHTTTEYHHPVSNHVIRLHHFHSGSQTTSWSMGTRHKKTGEYMFDGSGQDASKHSYEHIDTAAKNHKDHMKARGLKEDFEQIDEGPFKGIGKMMMKRKLKKGEADSMRKAETAYFDHENQDEFMSHMADRRKKEKAINRLNREEVEQIDEALVASHGMTSIHKKKDHYVISHTGSMGNKVDNSVKPNVDKMLGGGAFSHMKKAGKEEGSADYMYTMKVPTKHFQSWKKVQEEVEQIDELSKKTLGNYVAKAVVDVHNDARWAGETDDKDAKNKAFKRVLGVKSAASRLSQQVVPGGRINNFRRNNEEVEQIYEAISHDSLVAHGDNKFKGWERTSVDHEKAGAAEHPEFGRQGVSHTWVHPKTKNFFRMHHFSKTEPEAHIQVGRVTPKGKHAVEAEGFHHNRDVKAEMHQSHGENKDYMKKKNIKEEVNLDEHLENFWEAYTTMFNEAEDQQQNILLRAMAKDPSDLMKMKRAISMGDKALTNPALRQEILTMLDKMMTLTKGDPSLLQRTKAGFQKAKKLKMPEEVQLEEAEQIEEAKKPYRRPEQDEGSAESPSQYMRMPGVGAVKRQDSKPFEGGREVKSKKSAADRVKKIAKGMEKKYK